VGFKVALTFDAEHPDRPSAPGVQERLLELLARDDVTEGRSIAALFMAREYLAGRYKPT